MQTLSIEAVSRQSADRLCAALVDFGAETSEDDGGRTVVRVALTGGSDEIVALLNAIQEYVKAHAHRPATIEMGGQSYLMDAAGA